MKRTRAADPYRDLDVIDSRAPRFNQATVGLLALAAVVTGWWAILGLLAAQLSIGLTLGRRYCLPCLAYFELVQPRFGEGPIEDSRPPRFANLVGVAVLGAATVAYALGFAAAGAGLGLLVAGLALLAAATGLCAGCEAYRLGARLRGVRSHRLDRLREEGRNVVTVDVSQRPELARKYGVALVPTAVAVSSTGAVLARLAG